MRKQHPLIWVDTIARPADYTDKQLQQAITIAFALARGRLVLCEPPRR